ncbi:unnamed protein product [Notodromas monacha]|uniref:phosphorylase kinase n=1 Tax=Notodromas monacha TaxID=399045 RepID=A0A7R9BUM7_9CRUS|nr:unnamed protein product [Notodromas monacha]CAG0921064.1 unnamed protein product [Notodromas monacha]
MAVDEFDGEELPDKYAARGFYAKYEPKEILGKGVSSTVRRCIEKETGREFAAKIIDLAGQEPGDSDALRESTLREISILREVAGHPYIIELHDVYESDTFIFLVFELCKNGELFDYLTSVVTLSEKKTKYIMKQLFEALSFVHRKNIVHRDVKPENVLLDDNFNVKLTDFGFARKLKDDEKLHEVCGTPGYLAPELLKSAMFEDEGGYDKAVDVWACGVIMYTLLVGCPPFWHRKQMVMLRNIMEGRFTFSSPEWDDVTDSPKDLIQKILITEPAKRITIDEALDHEFFQILPQAPWHAPYSMHPKDLISFSQYKGKTFNARKMFQFGILCVRSVVRIKRLRFTPEPLSLNIARMDPYKLRALRKVTDAIAFRVYGHWVKRGEAQNRAALFENSPKIELKQIWVSRMSGV